MARAQARVALAVLTRDLRVHDNPTLTRAVAEAGRGGMVVAAFVLDEAILRSQFNRPNRARFLSESLRDVDAALRARGGCLVVRRGDWPAEVTRLAGQIGAGSVHVAADVTAYARRRLGALRERLPADVALHAHDDVLVVVPAGRVVAAGAAHMAVFTPYLRRWEAMATRDVVAPPRALRMPPVGPGTLPEPHDLATGPPSPGLLPGGEVAGRRRLSSWLRTGVASYHLDRDDLGSDSSSRLSPYLHLGALSPVEVVRRARQRGGPGAEAFVRQLAWRDFHHQLLAAHPEAARADLRPRGDRWRTSEEELAAWREGRTGIPVVDAGMRQLAQEGWMHNRSRLLAAHYLTKVLYLDWRQGARHFADLLVDADVANNTMNWQWVAGTGADPRYNRVYNLVRQAQRHDPHGRYVRRHVPELAGVDEAHVHQPWLLPTADFAALGYPYPLVDPSAAGERLRHGRRRG